jgi:transposase
MTDISFLGIDLAKSSFQIHGVDAKHKVVLRKKLTRKQLSIFVANLPKATIFMEACSGAHYFALKFREHGHEVKLIAPQFVKPFVKSNKSDRNDAEAIVEAGLRPSMNFVAVKTTFHLDIQAIHRVRQRLVRSRTALANEVRGILAEQGIVTSIGIKAVKTVIMDLLADKLEVRLSGTSKQTLADLHAELLDLDERIKIQTERLEKFAKDDPTAQRLQTIPGIGLITATAIMFSIADINAFKNGRQLAAWIGLVPKHSGTGGKNKIHGISKRGDMYLRSLLVQGAQAALRNAGSKDDKISVWASKVKASRGTGKAVVALANKNARIIFSLLKHGTVYQANIAA